MNKELARILKIERLKKQLPKFKRVIYTYKQKGYSKKTDCNLEPIPFIQRYYGKMNIVGIQYIRLPDFKGVCHVWYEYKSTVYYDLWTVYEQWLP